MQARDRVLGQFFFPDRVPGQVYFSSTQSDSHQSHTPCKIYMHERSFINKKNLFAFFTLAIFKLRNKLISNCRLYVFFMHVNCV